MLEMEISLAMPKIRCRVLFVAIAALILPAAVNVAAENHLEIVALTGQRVSVADDSVFTRLFTPTLNETGVVAFGGQAANPGGPARSAIWAGTRQQLRKVAQVSDQAPGTPQGIEFERLFGAAINDSGEVAFHATVDGTGANRDNEDGIWSDAGGTLHLVARNGDVAPGGNMKFHHLFRLSLNNAGETSFAANLLGSSTADGGSWVERSDGLTLISRRGAPAVGFPPGTTINITSAQSLDDDGAVTFAAFAETGGTVTDANRHAIWSVREDDHRLVVRQGDQVDSQPDGVQFRTFGAPMKRGSRILFPASLQDSSGEQLPQSSGLWIEEAGVIEQVVDFNTPPSGLEAGTNLFGYDELRLNGNGHVAFSGSLTGDAVTVQNQSAIFSTFDGELSVVVRGGDHAPETGAGTAFSRLTSRPFALNDTGQIAFSTELFGGDVNTPVGRGQPPEFVNNHGIWGLDRQGILRKVVRAGDWIDVDLGPTQDLRRVDEVSFYGQLGIGATGFNGFNNSGQLAFGATFTDGSSGIFFSNVLTVPEPSALLLFLAAVVPNCRWSRYFRNV